MSSYLRLNLAPNGYLAPSLGFPMKLGPQTEMEARGTIPLSLSTVTASFYADKQCDVHMALLCAPLLVNGTDSELLTQVDTTAVLTTSQDASITKATLAGDAVAQTGTVTISANSQSVTGSGTSFPTDGSWNGYQIQVKNGTWHQISSVTSAAALTINTPTAAISAASGAFYVRRPAPGALIFRIWIDNVQGGTVETIARDAGVTNISSQPQIPGGLTITKIVVA